MAEIPAREKAIDPFYGYFLLFLFCFTPSDPILSLIPTPAPPVQKLIRTISNPDKKQNNSERNKDENPKKTKKTGKTNQKNKKKNTESRIENRPMPKRSSFNSTQKNHRFGSNHHQRTIYPGFRFFRFSPRVSTTETDIDREIIKIDIPTWLLLYYISNLPPHFPLLTAMIQHAPRLIIIIIPILIIILILILFILSLEQLAKGAKPKSFIKPDPANSIACAYERPRHKSTRVAPQTRPTIHCSRSLPRSIHHILTHIYIYILTLPTLFAHYNAL